VERSSRPNTYSSPATFLVFPLGISPFEIDISLVDTTSLCDHLVQFTYSASGSRACRSFLQLIWLACICVVWTKRNHRLFRGSTSTSHQLFDKIKLFSYRWLRTTSVTLASTYTIAGDLVPCFVWALYDLFMVLFH
jgi:hypothetical protein